jgi:hypothetical protein
MIFQLDCLATSLTFDREAQSQCAIGNAQFPATNRAVGRRADIVQVVRHSTIIRFTVADDNNVLHAHQKLHLAHAKKASPYNEASSSYAVVTKGSPPAFRVAGKLLT